VLVAFSVTPIGTGEAVGEAVAEAVRVVRESGLPNRTDAMFTTIETGQGTPSRRRPDDETESGKGRRRSAHGGQARSCCSRTIGGCLRGATG
jgi:hypothetical protein